MLTAFKYFYKVFSKLLILCLLFQITTSIKKSETTFSSTEKTNMESLETYKEMAFSTLQLKTKLKLNTKIQTISTYYRDFNKINFSEEHVKYINLKSNINLKNKISNKDEIFAYYNKKSGLLEFQNNQNYNQQNKSLVAKAVYERTRFQTGWDKLYIKTFPDVNPLIQCYTTGFLEGVLSYKEIYSYYKNIHIFFYGEENYIGQIKNFYKTIDTNIKERIDTINKNNFKDEEEILHWSYITCLNAQINGLYKGYNSMADPDKQLDLWDFYFINSEGNFGDLKIFMEISNTGFKSESAESFYTDENLMKYYNTKNIDEIWKKLMKNGHCSAIAKLVKDDNGSYDILAGHNTWSDYSEMMRTLKTVDMAFEGKSSSNGRIGMNPRKINYSSYPGVLFSGDDFYELDSKVVILQTTLSVINKFIYTNTIDIKEYIPEFMRLMIINYTSYTGKQWEENYKLYKNHMYITQWLVVDYNVLNRINEDTKAAEGEAGTPNYTPQSLGDKYQGSGLIIMIEEVPTSILSEDVSKFFLDNTVIGSFNIAYFKQNQNLIGLDHYRQINLMSRAYNPRNYIMNILQKNVKNIEDFQSLIQYNGYHNSNPLVTDDPSYSDANSGISSRGDYGYNPDYHGGIDYKVVNKDLVDKMSFYVYGGPTYLYNNQFSPFDFSKVTDIRVNYRDGIPTLWNFRPFLYSAYNVKIA